MPSAAGSATASLFARNGLNWGGWRGDNSAALVTINGANVKALSKAAAATAAAAIPAAAAAMATAAAEVPVVVSTAAARTSAAATATVAGLPAAAAALPETSVKAAYTLATHDVTVGGWRFAGPTQWRESAAEVEAARVAAEAAKRAVPASAVQLSAAIAVHVHRSKAEAKAAAKPAAPHVPWNRSEWVAETMAAIETSPAPAVPTNTYVAPVARRRGGLMTRAKKPKVHTKVHAPYENQFLNREN